MRSQGENGGKYVYRSLEEAQKLTGYFSLKSVKIDRPLGQKIYSYLAASNLITHSGSNQAQTSRNTYTLRFCLKRYHDYFYIDRRGAHGHKDQYREPPFAGSKPKFDWGELYERTPTLMQMYFWICQKYSGNLLWVNCSHEPVPEVPMPEGDTPF